VPLGSQTFSWKETKPFGLGPKAVEAAAGFPAEMGISGENDDSGIPPISSNILQYPQWNMPHFQDLPGFSPFQSLGFSSLAA
jgi:hypothetical protein